MKIAHCIIKRLHNLGAVCITMFWTTTQHFVNHIDDGAGNIRTNSTKRCWVALEASNRCCLIILALKRNSASQAFVQNET